MVFIVSFMSIQLSHGILLNFHKKRITQMFRCYCYTTLQGITKVKLDIGLAWVIKFKYVICNWIKVCGKEPFFNRFNPHKCHFRISHFQKSGQVHIVKLIKNWNIMYFLSYWGNLVSELAKKNRNISESVFYKKPFMNIIAAH